MTSPPKSKVHLKDPVVSAVLAFLIPGAGHLYQRRLFKALLYAVCILGTYFVGLRLGDGKVVYFDWHPEHPTWAYLCQFWVGIPALPALGQRYLRSPDDFATQLKEPLTAEFRGGFEGGGGIEGPITGRVTLRLPGEEFEGELQGELTLARGPVAVTGKVRDYMIGPRVAPDERREFELRVELNVPGEVPQEILGRVRGSIARGLWDRYGAPLRDVRVLDQNTTDLQAAHSRLGTRFELGVVYTMIAGLLNILAIYDALEGPAYENEDESGDQETGGGGAG